MTHSLRRLSRAPLAVLCGIMIWVAGPRGAHGASAIDWNPQLPWLSFDSALEEASKQGKAVCVVAYADWCPKCRSLAPIFSQNPVLDASGSVLLVLQNVDERPQWLRQRFGDLGNYVPRIFFVMPDGQVNREINSGNERFPFFYRANGAQNLASSMKQAASSAARLARPVAVATPTRPATQGKVAANQPSAQPVIQAPANAAPRARSPQPGAKPAIQAQAKGQPPAPPHPAATAGNQGGSDFLAGSSDLLMLMGLVALALAAVHFTGRGDQGDDDEQQS